MSYMPLMLWKRRGHYAFDLTLLVARRAPG